MFLHLSRHVRPNNHIIEILWKLNFKYSSWKWFEYHSFHFDLIFFWHRDGNRCDVEILAHAVYEKVSIMQKIFEIGNTSSYFPASYTHASHSEEKICIFSCEMVWILSVYARRIASLRVCSLLPVEHVLELLYGMERIFHHAILYFSLEGGEYLWMLRTQCIDHECGEYDECGIFDRFDGRISTSVIRK